jgi:transporter family protein
MSRKQWRGKLIGGLWAALLFGLCGIFSKLSMDTGISPGYYLVCVGLGITVLGVLLQSAYKNERLQNREAIQWAVISGAYWGIASGLVSWAMIIKTPLCLLSPLYNLNTIIPVIVGIKLFKEKVYSRWLVSGTILTFLTGFILTSESAYQNADGMVTNYGRGLLWGGLIAAIFYGGSAVFLKMSYQAGIGGGAYLTWTGSGVMCIGLLALPWLTANAAWSYTGLAWALCEGITWGYACHCIGVAIEKYNTPIAVLAPLYNLNTLIPVTAGILFFGEKVSWPIVSIGTGFTIITGYILVKAQVPEPDTYVHNVLRE